MTLQTPLAHNIPSSYRHDGTANHRACNPAGFRHWITRCVHLYKIHVAAVGTENRAFATAIDIETEGLSEQDINEPDRVDDFKGDEEEVVHMSA